MDQEENNETLKALFFKYNNENFSSYFKKKFFYTCTSCYISHPTFRSSLR